MNRPENPEELLDRYHLLKEELLRKEEELCDRDSQIGEYAARVRSLEEYLNLFLQHPAYRVYKFLKRFLRIGPLQNHHLGKGPSYESYQRLFEPTADHLKQQIMECTKWTEEPSLCIVTAVYNPPMTILRETVQSVLTQTFGGWVWRLVDAGTDEAVWAYLQDLSARDSRIRTTRLERNLGISANMNTAFRQATEDFIAILDHDDTLAPFALYEVANVIRRNPGTDFVYSDADKLDLSGRRCEPLLKPDWSPEMLLCCNLLNQFSVFRRSWLEKIGFLNPDLDGAQDWDLYLRITEHTDQVFHIPQILYHWRKTPLSTAQATTNKPYVKKAQVAAITDHLKRLGLENPLTEFDYEHRIHGTHPLVSWRPSRIRNVSIIIPSKDHSEELRRCLKSLFTLTSYPDMEVVIVDTGSVESATWELYKQYEGRIRIVNFDGDFNFGKACNLGARSTRGELLLFLNNDTEILHADWIERLVQWLDFKKVGIVGCKLLYPGGDIQHAGVILSMGGLSAHLFREMPENSATMFGSDGWYRNVSAITGACLLIPCELFDSVHGFDEGYSLNYSDLDLCLRVREAGYRIVYTPHVRLIHHEGASHNRQVPRSDFERAAAKWGELLKQGDPYFNPNLSYGTAIPQFKRNQGETAEHVFQNVIQNLPAKKILQWPEDFR